MNINNYTIYCTPEQTKKAIELGAPIAATLNTFEPNLYEYLGGFFRIPTAEQMLGWLNDQGVGIDTELSWGEQVTMWVWYNPEKERIYTSHANSLKDATLESIDVALEYLSNNKK